MKYASEYDVWFRLISDAGKLLLNGNLHKLEAILSG